MNRSDFLKTSALATAGTLLLPQSPASAVPFIYHRPPQKFRVALIGSGWWGMNILRAAMQSGEVTVVALCDVDKAQVQRAQADVTKLSNERPKLYGDFRELLNAEKPDIAIVATPDHWHPLIAIAAMQTGAHVYVEKPISHTINEGKAMVRAARATGKVCQVGTHRRISPHNVSGMDFLRSGKAGKIGMVRAFVSYGGNEGKVTPDAEPPRDLDWDMWCGPAPLRAYNPTIHPRGFRQYLDYANGQLGDWGIHWLDQVLWWTDEKAPRKVYSTGGRAIRRDQTDAPDHQVATYEFEGFTAIWEHRLFAGNNAEKTMPNQAVGCYFYGTEGTFHMGWLDGWTFYPVDPKKPTIHQDAQLDKPDDQNIAGLWTNFTDSIRNNRTPVCDIEIGQRSTNMALLGMLSMKLGRSVAWDQTTQTILNDPEANALLSRPYRGSWQYPT
ncbi:oxidoreductase domain protein [Fibrella aestuarina BUZ 2]|uniref:Oxidoreductase domain protein n=1 Tax=Fibrella aestuarina BUZ 2 TaxID=1166018 RepID=I0K5H4_9BACT|nr:Gfo/Idh/MocA family oxidoreductase [Fibrella aestuarina]CCG99377.1 oxidoreductase domain protein [Fibrella aestuarina BUZ 2]